MHYHAMLAKVYGPELVLEPYVMSVDALTEQGTAGQAPCAVTICTPCARVTSLLCRLPSHLAHDLDNKNGKHAHCMCVKVLTARLLDMQDISCTLYTSFLPNLHRSVCLPFGFR